MSNKFPRESGKTNWVSKIRDMLTVAGFNFVWLYLQSVVTNVFVPLLKQRLKDTFITEWSLGIETSTTMLMFKNRNPLSKFHSTFLQFQMLNSDTILQK